MRYRSLDFVFNPNDFRDAHFMDAAPLDDALLQKGEVIIAVDRLALTANTISYGIAGKSRATIYRWEDEGLFPRRLDMGERSVSWKKADVDEWAADPAAWRNSQNVQRDLPDET